MGLLVFMSRLLLVCFTYITALADPADRFIFVGVVFWRRAPNVPPFSNVSTDLGHFIFKLLNLDIDFLFC